MSEDKTQDISQRSDTKPRIETILEEMRDFRAGVEKRFDSFDTRLERIETLVDRAVSVAFEARADMRELRTALREHLPLVK